MFNFTFTTHIPKIANRIFGVVMGLTLTLSLLSATPAQADMSEVNPMQVFLAIS